MTKRQNITNISLFQIISYKMLLPVMLMIARLCFVFHLSLLFRNLGCFYLGFLLTSIISDSIGFLIVKPIPAFPEVCQPEGCPKSWINIDDCNPSIPKDEFNNYFRSFPNYRSSASAYAAVYVAWYSISTTQSFIPHSSCSKLSRSKFLFA